MTSFWRNNDVIITPCVQGEPIPEPVLTNYQSSSLKQILVKFKAKYQNN